MQRITHKEIQKLAHKNTLPSVTMYAPLDGDYYDLRDRMLRMVRQARHELEQFVSYEQAREITLPLCEAIHDRGQWEYESFDQTVAIFLDKDGLQTFALPGEEPEVIDVGRGFRVVPLFEQLTNYGRFYTLLMTTKTSHLVRNDVHGIETVAKINAQDEKGSSNGDGRKNYYSRRYANGSDAVFSKRYLNRINKQVRKAMKDTSSPLVLVGLPKIQSAYRDVANYEYLMPQGVNVNPDSLSREEVAERAHPVAQRFYSLYEKAAQDELLARQATDQPHVVAGVRGVIEALKAGKVRTLFIDVKRPIWGAKLSHAIHAQRMDGDVDLTNLAIREALDHNTEIFRLPARSPAKDAMGILRY